MRLSNMNYVQDPRNTAQAKRPHEAVAQPLNERASDCASAVVQALDDFGAPRGVAKPLPPGRFLETLSGRDPLRVMRAAVYADDKRDAYGWAK